jgi:hypothetical protein
MLWYTIATRVHVSLIIVSNTIGNNLSPLYSAQHMHQRASLYAASIQARRILPYPGIFALLLTTPRFSFILRHQPLL